MRHDETLTYIRTFRYAKNVRMYAIPLLGRVHTDAVICLVWFVLNDSVAKPVGCYSASNALYCSVT